MQFVYPARKDEMKELFASFNRGSEIAAFIAPLVVPPVILIKLIKTTVDQSERKITWQTQPRLNTQEQWRFPDSVPESIMKLSGWLVQNGMPEPNTIISKIYRPGEESGAYSIHQDPGFFSGPLCLVTVSGSAKLTLLSRDSSGVERTYPVKLGSVAVLRDCSLYHKVSPQLTFQACGA